MTTFVSESNPSSNEKNMSKCHQEKLVDISMRIPSFLYAYAAEAAFHTVLKNMKHKQAESLEINEEDLPEASGFGLELLRNYNISALQNIIYLHEFLTHLINEINFNYTKFKIHVDGKYKHGEPGVIFPPSDCKLLRDAREHKIKETLHRLEEARDPNNEENQKYIVPDIQQNNHEVDYKSEMNKEKVAENSLNSGKEDSNVGVRSNLETYQTLAFSEGSLPDISLECGADKEQVVIEDIDQELELIKTTEILQHLPFTDNDGTVSGTDLQYCNDEEEISIADIDQELEKIEAMEISGSPTITQQPAKDKTDIVVDSEEDVTFGVVSTQGFCPHCHSTVMTNIVKKPRLLFACCVLPIFIDRFKNVEHYCPQCQSLIGRHVWRPC